MVAGSRTVAVVADDEEATAIEELWKGCTSTNTESSRYSLASKQWESAIVNLRWVGSTLTFNT